MNRILDSNSESSFETLNNMMVLLESSLFDVQIMMSQGLETLFEVLGIESAEILCSISRIDGDSVTLIELNELHYDEEEELFIVSADGGNELQWHELELSVQFEVVSQVHQKFVAEYKLAQLNQQEEYH